MGAREARARRARARADGEAGPAGEPGREAVARLPRSRPAIAVLVAALAAAALVYGRATDAEFHLDDGEAIQNNWRLRSVAETLRAFGPADLLGPARPVTEVTYAIDHAIGGLRPAQLLRTNLVLHLAVVVLVFLVTRRVLARTLHPRAEVLAAVVAALFAVHPIQVEAVSYAAQRSEVLASLLGLAATLVLMSAEDALPRRRALAASLAAAALVALALGAKTIAVAYPFAYVAYRLVVGAPGEPPALVRAGHALALAAPSALLAIASVARNLTVLAAKGASAGLGAGTLGPWRYFLTQLRVHWRYVQLLAVPAGFTIEHSDFPASDGVPDLATIAAGLGVAALVALALALWRAGARDPSRRPARAAAFGVLLWLLLLAPTSTFVPILDVFAEHRTYLACAGLFLAAVVAVDAALRRVAPSRAGVAGAALAAGGVASCAAVLAQRTETWRTELALWTEAASENPHGFRAALNHARALQTVHRDDEALAEYDRARPLAHEPSEQAAIDVNMAAVYGERGDLEAALRMADRGIAVDPAEPALRHTRAVALFRLGRYAEARQEAERGLALGPESPYLQLVRGAASEAMGDPLAAAQAYAACGRVDPEHLDCRTREVRALAALGRAAEACRARAALVAQSGAAAIAATPVGRDVAALPCP